MATLAASLLAIGGWLCSHAGTIIVFASVGATIGAVVANHDDPLDNHIKCDYKDGNLTLEKKDSGHDES